MSRKKYINELIEILKNMENTNKNLFYYFNMFTQMYLKERCEESPIIDINFILIKQQKEQIKELISKAKQNYKEKE